MSAVITRSPATGGVSVLTDASAHLCEFCFAVFAPKAPHQRFCSSACRTEYHKGSGPAGTVKAVRTLKTCCAIVVHLPHGSTFVPGDLIKLVKAA